MLDGRSVSSDDDGIVVAMMAIPRCPVGGRTRSAPYLAACTDGLNDARSTNDVEMLA